MAGTATEKKKSQVTSKSLKESLQKYFGFNQFKGQQEEIIKSIVNGEDTFVIMPTGGGKSLCYQLPALILPGTALVVSPLIALMKNQVDLIRGYSSEDNIAHFLNSSLNKSQQKKVKEDLTSGETKLLYVAPETMTKEENIEFFKSINISFIAVDEAHCISEWGHDFRPEYRRLRDTIDAISTDLPIIALTATATPKVQDDILVNLDLKMPNTFIASFNRPNLYYEIVPKGSNAQVLKHMVKFITQKKRQSGIIYTLNRKTTEDLAKTLEANGIRAVAYHAGLEAGVRARRQDDFLNDNVDVIVATIAFGMGIDKPDVRFVMHYNIPKSLENYYQETGRAGRDGIESKCILYYSYKDVEKLEHLMRDKSLTEREMGGQLIAETVAYVETASCRRRHLLHYFGEYNEIQNCGKCDNCCHPKEKLDVKDSVKIVLDAIEELNERFGINYIVDMVQGKNNPQIVTYRHDKSKIFGSGKIMEMEDSFWQSLIRQMMLENFIRKDIEEYGLLKITDNGRKFLENPYSIKVAINHQYQEHQSNDDEMSGGGGAADEALMEMLLNLRKKVAGQYNLPPYVIFQENSLEEMALNYPTTIDELSKISGVSAAKARKYGRRFVEMIAEYVEENEIERPDDFVMKNVANKGGLKIFIIQNIDRKMALETIAYNKDLTLDELLEEMTTIVESGTKLNIDYCLEDMLDVNDQEDIIEFMKGQDDDNLDEVYEEFGGNGIEMEQLQLMRIKFLSEYAN
ncbi:MAG: DNA helicase RecQ [Taibaiella sp.]|nr:DNA helicase RecQ [Taibaiella sp.]